jgi:hypothetical protein
LALADNVAKESDRDWPTSTVPLQKSVPQHRLRPAA